MYDTLPKCYPAILKNELDFLIIIIVLLKCLNLPNWWWKNLSFIVKKFIDDDLLLNIRLQKIYLLESVKKVLKSQNNYFLNFVTNIINNLLLRICHTYLLAKRYECVETPSPFLLNISKSTGLFQTLYCNIDHIC